MKAIVIESYGSADQLVERDVPKPEITEDQVLVELHATSINPVDWKMREGYLSSMMPFEFPIILGWDAAGIIKEVGANVQDFAVGDKIFSRPETNPRGTYAEYIAIDKELLAPMPKNVSFGEAASIPLVGETAWTALVEMAEIKKGDKVLIHAGAGGVGSVAIQVAKSFGATVASTASGDNEAYLKELGVDTFINYKEEDFESLLSDYDIVFDTMGGDIQKKSFNVLKKGGSLISIADEPDKELAEEKGIKTGYFFLQPDGKRLAKLGELMTNGKLKATVGETFPFTEEGLREAHRLSETHHAKGKIVINIK
ncbi:NADP-dependent oxidoreductase [Marinilactibacillus sp. Marseille-P9653]|uniref:NADP-dependent oxidoreductase n=1 Tax=Marinilactibacillus sp. Marseille-P9653 TaxID=2866583 RepID=UPI001CE48ECB|nr:NADP-dependent oxidoreductase [Marinilactibacillus sp. Marseille-P9653]